MGVEIKRARAIEGQKEYVGVVLTETPDFNEGYSSATAKVIESSNGINTIGQKVLINSSKISEKQIGDAVYGVMECETFDDSDRKLGFYGEGIYYILNCESEVTSLKSKTVYSFAFTVRNYVCDCLIGRADNYDTILAMITGERVYISDTFSDEVRKSGVSHILVISGAHLAILVGFLSKFLNFLRVKEIIKDIIIALFIFMMMCLCAFSMSIMRSGVIYFLILLYRRTKRMPNTIELLAKAVIIILFGNPFAFFSLTFRLTFASTLGILVLSGKISRFIIGKRKVGQFLKNIISIISVSLSAYIATLPIIILTFEEISLVAVITNLLVTSATTLMLIFSFLGVIFSFISPLARIFFMIADAFCYYFVVVVRFLGNLPFSVVKLKNTTVLVVLLFAAVLIYFIYKYRFQIFKRGEKNADTKRIKG